MAQDNLNEGTEGPAVAGPIERRVRPSGAGLGECPNWRTLGPWRDQSYSVACGCGAPKCKVCGHAKHSGIHMHCAGEKPGDPPWGHEYQPFMSRAEGRPDAISSDDCSDGSAHERPNTNSGTGHVG